MSYQLHYRAINYRVDPIHTNTLSQEDIKTSVQQSKDIATTARVKMEDSPAYDTTVFSEITPS